MTKKYKIPYSKRPAYLTNQKVDDTGKLQEVRERQHFTKRSDKLRKKKAAGTIRCKQKQRKAGLQPLPRWLK